MRRQRKKIRSGPKGIRGLKARVGWKCYISRGGGRLNSGGIQAEKVRGASHSAVSKKSRYAARGQIQE